jgi:hypothetical protein
MVADFWYFPVSHTMLPVSFTVMLEESVYFIALRLHEATTLTADGVTDKEV